MVLSYTRIEENIYGKQIKLKKNMNCFSNDWKNLYNLRLSSNIKQF